ncbi:MAG: DUF1223 domain-containing protein [Bauldia sp.]
MKSLAKPALMVLASLCVAQGASASSAAAAESPQPTVIELFTSQGCSSCPPANANLIKLRNRPGVLALTFSVTYWDKLGWKDTFGKAEFTDRQRVYEPSLGRSGPFTPQVVVNGRADVVGNRIEEIDALLADASRGDPPAVVIDGDQVRIGAGSAPEREADVWMVLYDPAVVSVPVRRGENGGRTLPQANVVHELRRIGGWGGKAVSIPLSRGPANLKVAVLVQHAGGPVIAASTD